MLRSYSSRLLLAPWPYGSICSQALTNYLNINGEADFAIAGCSGGCLTGRPTAPLWVSESGGVLLFKLVTTGKSRIQIE